MQSKLSSSTNVRVKDVVRLRDRKQRDKSGLTVIEGWREILRAIESKVKMTEVFISGRIDECKSSNIENEIINKIVFLRVPIFETTKSVFSKISYGKRDEGILAVCEIVKPTIECFNKLKKKPIFVVIESVEKPGNLGAILRTCDGAGVDGFIVCDAKTDVYNPNVIRSSLGTIFTVNIAVSSNEETLKFLRKNKIKVCSAVVQAKTVYSKIDFNVPLAIVVGSEKDGLSDFWIKNSDFKLRIPMLGKADSLNVSTSTAILLYEALRQRG